MPLRPAAHEPGVVIARERIVVAVEHGQHRGDRTAEGMPRSLRILVASVPECCFGAGEAANTESRPRRPLTATKQANDCRGLKKGSKLPNRR
jgi:hypothetical protein